MYLNKVLLMGHLGKDAEVKDDMVRFSLATTNSYKSKTGEWVNKTTWHNITVFKLHENSIAKLIKGALVYIEGRYESYENKDGITQHSVLADVVKVNSPKVNNEAPF